MTQPYDPTLGLTQDSVPLDQLTQAFKDATDASDRTLDIAKQHYSDAQAALAAIPPGIVNDDARKVAQDALSKAATVVENAGQEAANARVRAATALTNRRGTVSPELAARYQAMADSERASATKTQAETAEFLNTAPDRQAQLRATTQETTANAAVAQAKADLASATTDIEKQAAQTRLDQANASLQSTQLANRQAGLQNTITGAQAAVAPQVAQAGATKATAEATTAAAQAGVAPDVAQATLRQAQANADQAALQVRQLQSTLDATTDQDRRAAVQIELQQKQVALDAANQQLDAAKQLLPLSVAQAGANVQATTANTQKGLLGPLYGLDEQIAKIQAMIKSGQLDREKGLAQLQDFVNTSVAGTTPFQRDQFATQEDTARRGQDYSLAGTQSSVFGSGFGNALSTFTKLNDTTPVGSDAAGKGFLASLNLLGSGIRQFQPDAGAYPLAQSLRPQAAPTTMPTSNPNAVPMSTWPQTGAPGVPAASSSSGGDGHTITINIGGSGGSSGQQPAPTVPPPAPPMLTSNAPAMPNHVSDLWANDPNLNPGLNPAGFAASGAVDRTSQGLGGF